MKMKKLNSRRLISAIGLFLLVIAMVLTAVKKNQLVILKLIIFVVGFVLTVTPFILYENKMKKKEREIKDKIEKMSKKQLIKKISKKYENFSREELIKILLPYSSQI